MHIGKKCKKDGELALKCPYVKAQQVFNNGTSAVGGTLRNGHVVRWRECCDCADAN